MLYYLITALYVLVCLVLLGVILLQQGKGGDMAAAFGGGNSQAAFGARGSATLLAKITTGFAILFGVFAITLAIMGQRNSGSLMSGTAAPAPVTAPAAPVTPATSTAPATPPASAPAAPTEAVPGAPAAPAPATPADTPPAAPANPTAR